MKKLLFALMAVMIFACPVIAQRYRQHHIDIVDELGNSVTNITQISIYDVGTSTLSTIYGDRAGALSMENPVTTSSTNTTFVQSLGQLRWYQAASVCKLTLTDGTRSLTFNNKGTDDIQIPWYSNYLGDSIISEWDSAYTHISESGASHTFIDQDVTMTSSPTFADLALTGDIAVAGDLDVTGTVKATDLEVPTKGTATMVVAPSDATAEQKRMADYVCDGTADEVQINAAIVAAAAAGGRESGSVGVGGEVYLLAGNYSISAPIVILTRVSLIGQGNLQSVRISSASNSGHGIYFIARGAASSPISAIERGQFKIANVNLIMSLTQSAASWGIYIDNDGTEWIYDCIFDNVYCGRAKTGGMYVKNEWASHYDNCTFETGSGGEGPGFQSDGGSGSVFNGCYFAFNVGHGCNLAGSGGSHYFSNCCFHSNGDAGDASHGLYMNHASLNNIFISNCKASNNYGNGFFINQGTKALFTNCLAYKNDYSETWAKAGFRIGGSGVTGCILTNCVAIDNDGVTPVKPPTADGSGFYIVGDRNKLIGCYSSGNEYGVVLDGAATQCAIDIQFDQTANSHVKERYDLGGAQNRAGNIFKDTFLDCAALSNNGVHAAITQTGSAQTVTTNITDPGVPRNVTVTGDADAEGTVLIQGITATGRVFDTTTADEAIVVSPGATVQGNIAWSKITKITVPLDSSIPTAGVITIGWGDKLGLSNVILATGDIYKISINAADDALADYTLNATYGTVLPTAAINANDDFVIYYKGF